MTEIVVKLGENVIHKYFVDKDILNIGRARDNDIVIENLAVSRNHARIRRLEGKYVLTDLNSANGTFVNGVRVTKTEIMHNDVVSIGKHNLVFINKPLSDEQIISDAFGAERTMIVDRSPTGVLVITTGKQKNQDFKITKHETFIGRSANNDIRIHDWFVSKSHAQIIKEGNNHFIKDLGSWRGVFVNGQPIKDCQIKDGDDIKLGATHLTFHLRTEEPLQLIGRVPHELSYEEQEEEEEEVKTPTEPKTPTEEETPFPEEVEVNEAVEHVFVSSEEPEEPDLGVGFERLDAEEEEEKVLEDIERDVMEFEEEISEIGVTSSVDEENEESEEEPESIGEEKVVDEFEEVETHQAEEEMVEGVVYSPDQEVEEEEPAEAPDEEDLDREIAIWESALKNKSEIIRKEAARMLKKLTGTDYDT